MSGRNTVVQLIELWTSFAGQIIYLSRHREEENVSYWSLGNISFIVCIWHLPAVPSEQRCVNGRKGKVVHYHHLFLFKSEHPAIDINHTYYNGIEVCTTRRATVRPSIADHVLPMLFCVFGCVEVCSVLYCLSSLNLRLRISSLVCWNLSFTYMVYVLWLESKIVCSRCEYGCNTTQVTLSRNNTPIIWFVVTVSKILSVG